MFKILLRYLYANNNTNRIKNINDDSPKYCEWSNVPENEIYSSSEMDPKWKSKSNGNKLIPAII